MAEKGTKETRPVFIVYGHKRPELEATKDFLDSLGVHVQDFNDVRHSDTFEGRFVGDVLDHAFAVAQAVIVILTGDDIARIRPGYALPAERRVRAQPQPRPNVLIEIGMALMSHQSQVILVEFPPLREASDLQGMLRVSFSGNEKEFRRQFKAQLQQKGCAVVSTAPRSSQSFKKAVRRAHLQNLNPFRALTYLPITLLVAAFTLILLGWLVTATYDAYVRYLAAMGVFPDFKFAELEENVVYANNAPLETRPCEPGECIERTSHPLRLSTELVDTMLWGILTWWKGAHTMRLSTGLFDRGFSVLLFRKPRGTLFFKPTINLTSSDIALRVKINAPDAPVPFEVGLLDVNRRVIFFKCVHSSLGRSADFRVHFGPKALPPRRCGGFHAASVMQFSIGFATAVGSKPGDLVMDILGIGLRSSSVSTDSTELLCELQPCGGSGPE